MTSPVPSALTRLLPWLFDTGAPRPEGIDQEREQAAVDLFGRFFLEMPPLGTDPLRDEAFDSIITEQFRAEGPRDVEYALPWPKYDFLRYLVHRKGYLLHGTGAPGLDRLEPRDQTDWRGRPVRAVFASGDGIWPVFFALLDRGMLTGSIRNACLLAGADPLSARRFYFFSVNRETLLRNPWRDGSILVLPGDSFSPTSTGSVRFDEWASADPVGAVARVPVTPNDFPFMGNVTAHDESEPITETWLRYRERAQGMAGGIETQGGSR